MRLVGANLQDVADSTGLHISTVSRLRSGKILNPRRDVLLKLIAWSDFQAKKNRLRRDERLDWKA